jgi:hypothetical protein
VVVAAVLLAAGMVVAGRGAGASVPPGPRRAAGFDGRIRAAAAAGNTVYLGGSFTRATDVDGRVVTRNRLAAVDATTGALLAWNPGADKTVYALGVSGATVYLGGHFDNICPGGIHHDAAGRSVCTGAGTSRRKLLSVDAASGRPTAWNPSADSALGVFALAPVPGGALAAGGAFTHVGGAANRHLALFG